MTIHDIAPIHFPEQVPWLVRQYYRRYIPRFVQRADHIFAVSDYTKADIVAHCGASRDKVDITFNGCRDHFKALEKEEKEAVKAKYAGGCDYFFYVGAVHPRKNVHRLIEAFDRFKKQSNAPLKLLIAGRFSWDTGPVKTAYENALFKKDITFLGYLEDEKLPLLMGAARALVYVSLFEGFGMPLLEAMYCDVPVITSQSSSMPEVAGKAGKLVNPYKVDEIAGAMQAVYESPALRREMIEEGRLQREKFNWDITAQVVYDALVKVENRKFE